MSREEIMNLGFEELESRRAAIAEETKEADTEQLEALNSELDSIEERKKALDLEIEERKKAALEVVSGAGTEIETRKEDKKMTNLEIRNTPEYIEAYAKYVKTGKDLECRALLTENVSGTVPVPEFVEGRVRANWERDEVWRRVRKTYVRGNLKVGFEISASDAAIHTEGGDAPEEETLTLGIVNMVPANIKKWITVSDEVLALGAEEFLAYIYDELTYKIIQFAADTALDAIIAAAADGGSTMPFVADIPGTIGVDTIIDAIAQLGDGAQNICVIASGETIATIKKQALLGSFAFDPFQGATVIQKAGVDGVIVGDLAGVQANLPEGDSVKFVFDPYTYAESDMVKIVGRLYAAIAVTSPRMFAYIAGGSSSSL